MRGDYQNKVKSSASLALGCVTAPSPTRRVMADELQWIVQDLSGDQWKNIGYCRCRDTILERLVTAEVEEAGN